MRSGLLLPQEMVRRVKSIAAEIDDLIRVRAYALWRQEGRPDGRNLNHWVQAEAEIWRELIRERAHALWEQEDRSDGHDLDRRMQAEAEIWHQLIQERAYELWEREGRPAGQDFYDWLQAEAAIEAARFANWPVRVGAPWAIPRA
jgi:hypothetical protein